MPVVCSCNVITYARYREAARENGERLSCAKSFGAAVSMLFQETHAGANRTCHSCVPSVGRAIAEENLRPKEEFERWAERRLAAASKCADCPTSKICGVAFDYSPRG